MKIVHSPIISCSRRTDIPAFLMKWVLERMEEGYVDVVNPFNRKQVARVSLSPEHVKCWCWWSKDYGEWIKTYKQHQSVFDSYLGHYFQFTINSPSELEKGIKSSLEQRFEQMKWLIDKFGVTAMNFRFDPIVLYKRIGETKVRSNLSKFEYIIKNVSQLGIKEVIFSFATPYSKVETRMRAREKIFIEPSFQKKRKILDKIQNICAKYSMELFACCQPRLLKMEGIKQAHCIDAYKIEKIIKQEIPKKPDKGQREACGCFKSKDIGGYTGIFRCKHNCDYCYASPSRK